MIKIRSLGYESVVNSDSVNRDDWVIHLNGIIDFTMKQISVVLADDHAVVRAGIKNAIEGIETLTVVGEAFDGPSLMAAINELVPDLLLIDVTMPEFQPVLAIEQIKKSFPDLKILVISAYDDDIYVQGLLKAGVDGYHMKDQPLSDLQLAVSRVLAGEKWISSSLVDKLVRLQEKKNNMPSLTSRQMEILNLLQTSHSNQTIALKLNLSVKTIENHLTRIYRILGVQSRLEAVNYLRNHPELLKAVVSQTNQMDQKENPEGMMSILVVDDNSRFRSQLSRMIRNYNSNTITLEAENIADALSIAKRTPIHLAFVDMILRDQSGLDCTKQLKKVSPQSKLIVISAFPDKEFNRLSMEAGATAFIDKKELNLSILRNIIEDAAIPNWA